MPRVKAVVTAGPTYEPLDEVRRLTNFSTGKLGSDLANYLTEQGHDVVLLVGYYAIHRGELKARRVETFTTTADLRARLEALSLQGAAAVFHAAAVRDLTLGGVFERSETGELVPWGEREVLAPKGPSLAELKPAPDLIGELRGGFAQSKWVGWKYELD